MFDFVFQELQNLIFFASFTTKRRERSRPPSSSPILPISFVCHALTLHVIVLPTIINPTPLNIVLPMAANNPWGPSVGPLALGENLNPLPKGSRDHLPKFSGDGKVMIDDHLNAFNVDCDVL